MTAFQYSHVFTKICTEFVERVLAGEDIAALSAQYDDAVCSEDAIANRIHDAAVIAAEEAYWIA